MDFVEGLPKSDGFDSILVVVDRLTKFAHFIPLRHPFSAAQVARAFWDNFIKNHGIPLSIVSDRGSIFTSALWRSLMEATGTKIQFSTAYHPQTNGQMERVNQCMEMFLRCAIHDTPTLWRRWLPAAEFWYNSSHHASLTCSPFKALFGREPNFGAMSAWVSADSPVTDLDWENHTARLRQHLSFAQARFKRKADKNRTEREFYVGESVLLKLQPYSQSTVANRSCKKLVYKFYGPFPVE
jgi:transposase InsO family protein